MVDSRPGVSKVVGWYAGRPLKERAVSDDRLLNIETAVAYQDDLLLALNRTVANQALRIDALEKQLRLASEQLQQIAELLVAREIIDEKPPHY